MAKCPTHTRALPKKKRRDPQTINHLRKEEKGRENKKKEGKKNQNDFKEARKRTHPHRNCLSYNDSNKVKQI